jgi:hypothetical protein
MDQTFNNTQIQQIKVAVEQVIEAKFGPDVHARLDRIENNTDAACKVGSDNRQELAIAESKVDDHEVRITDLESNFVTT